MPKSAAWLLVLVLLMVSFAATTEQAEAQYYGTVTIKADGSIDPATAPISTNDNVTYTLTDDIHFNISPDQIRCIKVERFNTVLDGAGHTIQGNGDGRGIEISNPSGAPISEGYNVTVRNFNVKGFENGISVFGYWGNIISGVVIAGNNVTTNYLGVTFASYYTYSDNVIIENNITENYVGIDISMANEGGKTKGNLIIKNYVANNTFGMVFYWKSSESYWYGSAGELQYSNVWDMNNTVFNNNFVNNSQNVQKSSYNPYIQTPACSNVWDSNRTGNFWSDYNGTDADGDGLGDTPYVIDANNQDYYPLMATYKEPEVKEPEPAEPFPAMLVATASGVSIAAVAVGLLLYFKKRKR